MDTLVKLQTQDQAIEPVASEPPARPVRAPRPKKGRRAAFRHAYDLMYELVSRDIKTRYKRSVLGFAWSLLLPLSQLLVFVFLFHRILAQHIEHYPAYVFSGVLAWNWFQASIISSAGSIVENRDLVRQPNLPLAVLPFARMTTDLIHFVFALPILFAFILIGGGKLGWPLLAMPFVIISEGVLVLGLSYFAAALNVTFRDTRHLLTALLMLFFYLTPIFWTVEYAPAKYKHFLQFNPMYQVLDAYRAILLHNQWPDAWKLLGVVGVFSVVLALGYLFFQKASEKFVEEV